MVFFHHLGDSNICTLQPAENLHALKSPHGSPGFDKNLLYATLAPSFVHIVSSRHVYRWQQRSL